MESAKVGGTRATRTRGKSTSSTGGETPSAADAEMAPNLNGNKDGGGGETETAVEPVPAEDAPAKEVEAAPEGAPATKKRKLSNLEEANEEQSTTKEEPVPDEAKIEPEKPAEEKVNDLNVSAEEKSMDTSDPNTSTDEITNKPTPPTPKPEPAPAKPVEKASTEGFRRAAELKTLTPGSETYGKGKRARVPNKRYSDIIRTVTRPPKAEPPTKKHAPPPTVKNGEFPDDDLGEILREESELEARGNKKIKPVDVSNPAYLKPFDLGWKRELVIRSTSTDGRRYGDVYYYNPSGRKLRSMREITDHLKASKIHDLTGDNFTFFKEPIGVDDPDQEIIRDAKATPGGAPMNRKIATSKLVSKPTKRSKTPVSGSASSPSKVSKQSKTSFKVKAPVKPANKKKDAEAESPTNAKQKGKANLGKKLCQPCSIRCDGMQGHVPCLQCRICLCLYHNECMGIPGQVTVKDYVCKNCQLDEPSDVNTGKLPTASSNIPAKTPTHPSTTTTPERNVSHATNVSPSAKLKLNNNNTEQRSLVGSLTTWFPPASTIQVGNHESDTLANVPRRPQLVEYIGNKKYVVVPRHSILSVRSPAQADAAHSVTLNAVSEPPHSECVSSPDKTPTAHIPSPQVEHAADAASTEDALASPPVEDEKPTSTAAVKTVARATTARTKDTYEPSAGPPNFMNTYMQNLQYGYTTLFCVFQYLKVQDLLRAGCVCTMWRDMSRYPALWRTVRMKNSQIHSFDGMANALLQHGTVHLDLRKMLLPSNATNDDIWPSFTNAIKKVESLRRIELCRCLASVVEDLARNNHNLEVINAVTLKCESMTFEPFENLTNLVDLRLKSTAGLTLSSDLSALKALTKLKHLSITSIKDLNKLNIEVIGELVNLEVLDLGECSDFPKHFGPDILSKLTKLEKLRLEKGQGECFTFDILEAVKGLSELQQLELVNFDIKTGFDKSLGACANIRKLLIIPTYISQSATTNHMVLGGVLRLQKTLSHFVWGVTLELLRVTELFVDQCEQPDKKEPREKGMSSGDSIPVLKPVPLQGIQQTEVPPSTDTPQVEILPLPNLQKLLLQNLPTTRVKILKIPFHATWRQSITDSVN